jgi:hypothetical protein
MPWTVAWHLRRLPVIMARLGSCFADKMHCLGGRNLVQA